MKISGISGIILLIVVMACSACRSTRATTAPAVTASTGMSTAPAVPVAPAAPDPVAAAIASGRNIYQTRCDQCHSTPIPGDYNQSDWSQIMIKMSRKAHLTDSETDQVLAYINSVAKP